MLTALFLASKTEECRVDAATVCRRAQKPSWDKEVLKFEVPLLDALDFKLTVSHPHVAAEAWIEDLKESGVSVSQNAVNLAINDLMVTDAALLFPATHIAMGAVVNCIETSAGRDKAKQCFANQFSGDLNSLLVDLQDLLVLGKGSIASKRVAPIEKTLTVWVKSKKKVNKDAAAQKKKKKDAESMEMSKKRLNREEDNEEPLGAAVASPGDFVIKTSMKKRVKFDE